MRRLENKVAIVTGAGSVGPGWGNGRAIAWRFASEGARVFAVDMNADALTEMVARVKEVNGVIRTWTADVTSADAVREMVQAGEHAHAGVERCGDNVGG